MRCVYLDLSRIFYVLGSLVVDFVQIQILLYYLGGHISRWNLFDFERSF